MSENNEHRIRLTKLNTLDDAKYPQKEKYPDNTIKSGLCLPGMLKPIVGKSYWVIYDEPKKLGKVFKTSGVKEIVEENQNFSIFKTSNSLYKVEYLNK